VIKIYPNVFIDNFKKNSMPNLTMDLLDYQFAEKLMTSIQMPQK